MFYNQLFIYINILQFWTGWPKHGKLSYLLTSGHGRTVIARLLLKSDPSLLSPYGGLYGTTQFLSIGVG